MGTKAESRYLHVGCYRYRRIQITSAHLKLRGCGEWTLALAPSSPRLIDDHGKPVHGVRRLRYVPVPLPAERPRWLERQVKRGGHRHRPTNAEVAAERFPGSLCHDHAETMTSAF